MNPDEKTLFIVTSLRLEREVHKQTRLRLIERGDGNFSDFVNQSMRDYLERTNPSQGE